MACVTHIGFVGSECKTFSRYLLLLMDKNFLNFIMTIDLHSSSQFPYGTNIHFVYQIASAKLIFLHQDFDWLIANKGHHDDLVDLIISKIYPEDLEQLTEAFGKAVNAGLEGMLKIKLLMEDRTRWLLINPLLAYKDGEKLLIGSLSDITDEVENTEIIARYAHKKNSILHMLSHDLRGPLNMAKSVLKILDLQLAEPDLRKKTHYIADILQQAIALITDLVTRELMETTEVVLVRKQVDIVKKLTEYLSESGRSVELADRTFDFRFSDEEIFMEVDEAKFMQIINNLMSNALKFTRPGGHIAIEVRNEGDWIHFRFTDDGIGIPSDQLDRIFDKFTTARRAGLSGEPTLGLGLSIVKTIVDWHNGNIWCESKEEMGTTFHFVIPKKARGI